MALALLTLWREGYVESITPPPAPRHLLAQQVLALCLQEGRIGRDAWPEWLTDFDPTSLRDGDEIVDFLLRTGHLDTDQGMLFIGPETDEKFGRFYFRDLVSSFTSAPDFAVLHGRHQLGFVDPMVVIRRLTGPRRLLLAGRSWQVNDIDWARRRLYVEPSDIAGTAQWFSPPRPRSFALANAMRRVALGAQPTNVTVSDRAQRAIALLRESHAPNVDQEATVVVPRDGTWHTWWTWVGGRGNLTLATGLDELDPGLVAEEGRTSDLTLRISADAGPGRLRKALRQLNDARLQGLQIPIEKEALRGLKFADLLPTDLAADTISRRLVDLAAARSIARHTIADRT